jgi:thiamine-monophosphate kinase
VITAAMDLSDGLASDLRRISESSGVGIELDSEAVPVAPEVIRLSEAHGWDPFELAFAGGEDFELLVSLPEQGLGDAGVPLTPVGRVVQEGLWIVRGERREPLPEGGWDHYRRGG